MQNNSYNMIRGMSYKKNEDSRRNSSSQQKSSSVAPTTHSQTTPHDTIPKSLLTPPKTPTSSQAPGISITKRYLNDSDSTLIVKILKYANEADNTPDTLTDDEMLSINQNDLFHTKQNNDQDNKLQDYKEKNLLDKTENNNRNGEQDSNNESN